MLDFKQSLLITPSFMLRYSAREPERVLLVKSEACKLDRKCWACVCIEADLVRPTSNFSKPPEHNPANCSKIWSSSRGGKYPFCGSGRCSWTGFEWVVVDRISLRECANPHSSPLSQQPVCRNVLHIRVRYNSGGGSFCTWKKVHCCPRLHLPFI